MSYAIFSQQKVFLTSRLNSTNVQQMQRQNEQSSMATNTTNLQQELSSLQVAQSSELSDLYEDLAAAGNETQRASINAEIKALELSFTAEEDQINRKITQTSTKENAIELQVKSLDTQVSSLTKQLDAVKEAESSAMDRATPKYTA